MIERASTPEARATLVAYLASKMGTTPFDLVGHMPFEVVATMRNGKATGAVLYYNYRGPSIEMACAGEPGWLTRETIRDAFLYPFVQLGCWTVLTQVARSNTTARKFNQKLGFIELGVIESGPSKSDDVIVYKMTRDRCVWIRDGVAGHGQEKRSKAA